MDKIFPATRKATGIGHLHYAYVYRRNRVVRTCTHHHRSMETAQKCAEKMTRQYLREIGAAVEETR